MSAPSRKAVQTTFGEPESKTGEKSEGTRQTTLERSGMQGAPVTITPEAYERAYKEARAKGPLEPIRLMVPAGLLGGTRIVTSPTNAVGQGQRPITPAVPPVEARVPIIPPAITDRWHIPSTFEQRELQQDAVAKFLEAHRGTVLLPTGTGKTEVAILIIYMLRIPALVLVHSRVLLSQWVQRLASWGIDSGVYYGEEKSVSYVTVALYQSLFRHPEGLAEFPLIIADEGDMASADEWDALLEEAAKHPYALVMTAELPSEGRRRAAIETTFPILIRENVANQIKAGNLVPARLHPVPIELTGEERKTYTELNEKLRKLSRAIGSSSIYEISRMAHRAGDHETRRLARTYLALFAARKTLLAEARNKVTALVKLVQENRGRKGLLFGTIIEALEDACGAVNTEMGDSYCRIISGETISAERSEILRDWGSSFFLLASAQVLGRGMNVPDLDLEIVVSASASKMEAIQRLGRVLRPAPGKTHSDVFVVYAEQTVDDRVLALYQRTIGGPAETTGPLDTVSQEEEEV